MTNVIFKNDLGIELPGILGADHMFSNKEHEKKMIDLTVEWFRK